MLQEIFNSWVFWLMVIIGLIYLAHRLIEKFWPFLFFAIPEPPRDSNPVVFHNYSQEEKQTTIYFEDGKKPRKKSAPKKAGKTVKSKNKK